MNGYNLYYNGTKINNKILSKEDLINVAKHKAIYKYVGNIKKEIPTDKLIIKKCTVI